MADTKFDGLEKASKLHGRPLFEGVAWEHADPLAAPADAKGTPMSAHAACSPTSHCGGDACPGAGRDS